MTVPVHVATTCKAVCAFFDHLRAGVRPRVPGAVPWREKYHAAQ